MPRHFVLATARDGMMLERERVLNVLQRFAREGNKNGAGGALLQGAIAVIRSGEHHVKRG